jgi:quaternary ammonium compound-resistance protein SugE
VELLFIVLIGVLVGLAGQAVLPNRALLGTLLLPAIGGSAAAVVWVALTWASWPWDGGWIWVATIAATVLSVAGAGMPIGRTRAAADDRRFAELAGSGRRA